MTETSGRAQWFSDNERNWDDRAELHMAGNYCDYQRLLEDAAAIFNYQPLTRRNRNFKSPTPALDEEPRITRDRDRDSSPSFAH